MKLSRQVFFVFWGLVLVITAYMPGITGALYYDDYLNLRSLNDLNTIQDITAFIFGGNAGPLGRPIALLTFVPFAQGWPVNSEGILLFNVLLHACNFLLVFALGYNLISISKVSLSARDRFFVALLSAFFWASIPLLASTSLIAIQRMTGLAAFFSLIGLLCFTYGYKFYPKWKNDWAALSFQLVCLSIFTVLSAFSKENGLLTPVFALLINCIVVGRKDGHYYGRKNVALARTIALMLPLLYILYYLSPLNRDWLAVSGDRGFSPLQRLYTQSFILWDYLRQGFLPQSPSSFGPFHDYFPLLSWSARTQASVLAWALAIIVSLLSLKKTKWIFFAVTWFLIGHLLESTTIPLELYFEHRNYLALYGICLGVTVGIWSVRGKRPRLVKLSFISYILLLWVILLATSVRWGQPQEAAESWTVRHPGSARAVLHSIFLDEGLKSGGKNPAVETAKLSTEFIFRERKTKYLQILDKTKKTCPDCIEIRLIALLISCEITPKKDQSARMDELLSMARDGTMNNIITTNLFSLVETASKGNCVGVSAGAVNQFLTGLTENPKSKSSRYGPRVLFTKAMIAEELGELQVAEAALARAEELSPLALPVLQYQIYLAKKEDNFLKAKQAIERRQVYIEKNGIDDSELSFELIAELLAQLDN